MTPAQQVAYYEEQARLCREHAAHQTEQARLHLDYVKQLITFHGLPASQDSTPRHAPPTHVEQAPPGFHHARPVNVGASVPPSKKVTIRYDPREAAAAAASGAFTAQAYTPPAQTQVPSVSAPLASPSPHAAFGAAVSPAFTAPLPSPVSTTLQGGVSPQASTFAVEPPRHDQNVVVEERAPANGKLETGAPKASITRAVGASVLGVFIGAALWGGIGFITGGWEFKYGAVLIGFIVGGLALKGARAPSKAVGIAAGVMSLISLLLGKALFELLVHPGFSMGEHIAYHTTIIDLIFYGATAVTGFVVASSEGAVGKIKAQLGRYIPALR